MLFVPPLAQSPSLFFAKGQNLIIVPFSLLKQWEDELAHTTNPPPRVLVYHREGEESNHTVQELVKFDVILTTYKVIRSQYKASLRRRDQHHQEGRDVSKTKFPIFAIHWKLVVLEEGHKISNLEAIITIAAREIQSQHRILVTRTPIQNGYGDMYSIMRFLHIPPWDEGPLFRKVSERLHHWHEYVNMFRSFSQREGAERTCLSR